MLRGMTLRIALVVLLLALPGVALATDLQITDTSGAALVVRDAVIDYGGMLSPDTEKDGVRVQQGDGVVRLKWSAVESITVTKVDTSVRPARIDVEVALVNGKRLPATLFRKGAMKLTGKTDLGDYAIDVDKIRRVAPAH